MSRECRHTGLHDAARFIKLLHLVFANRHGPRRRLNETGNFLGADKPAFALPPFDKPPALQRLDRLADGRPSDTEAVAELALRLQAAAGIQFPDRNLLCDAVGNLGREVCASNGPGHVLVERVRRAGAPPAANRIAGMIGGHALASGPIRVGKTGYEPFTAVKRTASVV